MRDSYEKRRTSVLTWLICAIVAIFVVQNVSLLPGLGMGLERSLGLSPDSLRAGHLWTLVTYGFLHSTGNLLQAFAYVVVIFLAGREVLPILGARRFIGFYLSAVVVGGLFWTALHWRQPGILLGASAAVAALVILYACFYPNREMTLLLFFVLPVSIKPKYLACMLIAIDLCGLVFYEILGLASPFYAAHSAHLGGMAAGWVYFRYIHDLDWSFASGRAEIEFPRWMKKRGAAKAEKAAALYTVNVGGQGNLRAEVDRILDKINSDGFGSLSADEKRILDEARDLIGRR
jgi:membrane associated rhomboid family serine protease